MIVNRAAGGSYETQTLVYESMSSRGHTPDWGAVRDYLQGEKFVSGEYACFVAYVQGLPTGVIVAERHNEGVLPYYEVHNLYVIESCRGRRVAPALLRKALDWAGDDEALLYVTTVGEPNPLFRRLGLEPTHQICVTSLGKIREVLK